MKLAKQSLPQLQTSDEHKNNAIEQMSATAKRMNHSFNTRDQKRKTTIEIRCKLKFQKEIPGWKSSSEIILGCGKQLNPWFCLVVSQYGAGGLIFAGVEK